MREKNPAGCLRQILIVVTWMSLICVGMASLTGFVGQFGAWFDIFSNFRALYVVLLVIPATVGACLKRGWIVASALLLALINGLTFVPLYLAGSGAVALGESQFRVLELNVFGGKNLQRAKAIQLINSSNADLVGISEVTAPWVLWLQKELKQYPYQVYEPRFGGVALLSKFPLKNSSVEYFSEIKRPRITANAQIRGRNVRVVFAHPVIPLYRKGSRDEELVVLSNEVKSSGTAAILFGDLNVTPWSYNFNKLLSNGGLIDSERGFGFQPTWCAFWSPFSQLFPIDHCLVTNDFHVSDRQILENIGSDHLPLQVDLRFKQ